MAEHNYSDPNIVGADMGTGMSKGCSRGFHISGVRPGSPAERAGIKAGDRLLKIGDSFFYDLLDYFYLCADRKVTFLIERKGERAGGGSTAIKSITVRKDYDEDVGLEFLSPVIGPLRHCRNRCVFCFIDQQPPSMRPSLYEKDDDYRLSFFHGNYISLTNIDRRELGRILRRKLSPLYISIHATDPAVRRRMMRNKNAGNILEMLLTLAGAGVEMHGQIVICPGYNDGAVLEKTVHDLSEVYPALKTVAFVPVGLTGYRDGLAALRSLTAHEALEIIDKYTAWQDEFSSRYGEPFIYMADELYLLAGRHFPPHEHYGSYPQIENGVGLGRLFLNQVFEWDKKGTDSKSRYSEISIATAKAAEPLLKRLMEVLVRIPSLTAHLHVIPHYFWGGDVTVSGLLTGSDLLRELSGKNNLGEALFISRAMLKKGSTLFLDNTTVEELSFRLQVRIIPVEDPLELRRILIGRII